MLRWSAGQVALRSSEFIASSTATRVSTVPERVALADSGPQQRAKQVLVVVGGLGGIDEPLDDLDEAIRVVVERKVARLGEDLQTRAGHRRVGQPGVADRYHRVVLAPNQLHWNGLREITSV